MPAIADTLFAGMNIAFWLVGIYQSFTRSRSRLSLFPVAKILTGKI
jgi:hypothetical protein